MAEYQLKWITGRLEPERKCVTKNDQNFDEKCEILDFVEIDPESKNASKINDFRQKSDVFKTNFFTWCEALSFTFTSLPAFG